MVCEHAVNFVKFEWLDSYEIGHKEIDDDHRHMFSIMKQVEAAGRELRFECCAVLLDELVAFTRVHFAREEALLQRIGFPAAKQHKAYHARLLARAENVKEVCKVIKSEQTFLDCCEEMFSFLIDDILTGDLAIKAYLQETGVAERC
jgi:hemerythrin